MMAENPLLPKHEDFRRAMQWLSCQDQFTVEVIEEAARRFDRSPIDERVRQAASIRSAG
jgi:hypothetical protein